MLKSLQKSRFWQIAQHLKGSIDEFQYSELLSSIKDAPLEIQPLLKSSLSLSTKSFPKISPKHFVFCDRLALEQSSHSSHSFFKDSILPHGTVADLCCGMGGDSFHFQNRQVVGIDLDPSRISLFKANALVNNLSHEAILADATRLPFQADWFLIDPDRRDPNDKRKNWNPQNLHPTLNEVKQLARQFKGGLMKLSPAADPQGFQSITDHYLYLGGKSDCRETLCIVGELKDSLPKRAALLFHGQHTYQYAITSRPNPSLIGKELPKFLYDPRKVLLRSGGLSQFSVTHQLQLFDPNSLYLGNDIFIPSPWIQGFEIIASSTIRPKKITAMVKNHNAKIVAVKKRGVAIDPDIELMRHKKMDGDVTAELVYTIHQQKPLCLLVKRLNNELDSH